MSPGADRRPAGRPRAAARRERARRVATSRSHQTGLPAGVVGGGAGDVEAADAGELAHRLLAGRVDVEHADLVGRGERGAEAPASALVRE